MEKEQRMQILSDLVELHSVNGDELPVANYLKKLLDNAGIKNEILPLKGATNRANLVAEVGSGKPVLVISGHMDTVDVNEDKWNSDPFKISKKGDLLYGRGTTDMKAGLAAMVIALIELKEKQVEIPGTIHLLATAGEEVGQPGAEQLQQAGYLDDADALLIGEPSGYNRSVYASKGEININLLAKGKTAHSSMPFLGINAVENMLELLNQIKQRMHELSEDKHNEVLGDTVFNIDVIHGGNQVNAIPGTANAELNIRTIPELTNETIIAELQSVVEQYNADHQGQIEMSVGMNIVPIVGDPNAKLVQVVHAAAKSYVQQQKQSAAELEAMQQEASLLGQTYEPGMILNEGVSGGTDASKFLINNQTGFAYLVYGPGSNTPHQDNEYVSEQMYLDFIEIYKQIFQNYGK
ncbi:ArgE/DapE family deacylase [Lactobacillus sp. ESL0684]|uniref:ArgE/DapE family deacylase n=1 Tax=Lactobacillus sp. ESL0684 TaxID=2983213 RepID=UPI0023F95711|nr:ArgE/DapE family deacylase [Lactobacillus sp. ESL0684]WEV43060.1 ArgE/DapE family deacylase [Lactobacillus sp. ESL0684]